MCLPWYVVINGCTSVQKDNHPHYRGWNEHLGIKTQPGEVQTNLLSKVLPIHLNKSYSDYSDSTWSDRAISHPRFEDKGEIDQNYH